MRLDFDNLTPGQRSRVTSRMNGVVPQYMSRVLDRTPFETWTSPGRGSLRKISRHHKKVAVVQRAEPADHSIRVFQHRKRGP